MSLWLDDNELHALTGYKNRAKQAAVLAKLRPPIQYRVRPHDSYPLVERAQFQGVQGRPKPKTEPNYG